MISDSPPPPPDPSSIPLPDGGEMGEREEAMEDDDEDGPVIDYRNNYSYNPHHQQPPQQLDPWTYLARLVNFRIILLFFRLTGSIICLCPGHPPSLPHGPLPC